DRPAFGLALASKEAEASHAGYSGKTYSASVTVNATADATIHFLLAFDEAPSKARGVLAQARDAAPPAPWGFPASLQPTHLTDPRHLAAESRAYAILRMGEVVDPTGALLGGSAAKSHYNEFWVWDSSFHALAVSEWDALRAFAHLEGVYRGQVTDPNATEFGLLY